MCEVLSIPSNDVIRVGFLSREENSLFVIMKLGV